MLRDGVMVGSLAPNVNGEEVTAPVVAVDVVEFEEPNVNGLASALATTELELSAPPNLKGTGAGLAGCCCCC